MTKQHPVTVVHKSWNVIEQKNKETKGSIKVNIYKYKRQYKSKYI